MPSWGVLGPACLGCCAHVGITTEERSCLGTWLTGAQLCASSTTQPSVSSPAVVSAEGAIKGLRGGGGGRGGRCGHSVSSIGWVRWVPGGLHAPCLDKLSVTTGQELRAVNIEVEF